MNGTPTSIFRKELERRLTAEADLVIGNSVNSKKIPDISGSSYPSSGMKPKISKLKFRDLLATLRFLQPCCFPTAPPSKFSAPGSRKNSIAPRSRSGSFAAATRKIKTSCGRLSNLKQIDKEVVQIFLPVKCDILTRLMEDMGLDNWGDRAMWDISLTVISYKTQIVFGMNYFVKIRVNDGPLCIHCRIYQPIEGEPFLTDVCYHKKTEDDIDYF